MSNIKYKLVTKIQISLIFDINWDKFEILNISNAVTAYVPGNKTIEYEVQVDKKRENIQSELDQWAKSQRVLIGVFAEIATECPITEVINSYKELQSFNLLI